MTVDINALIILLDGHPEWRFFNRFGEEYVYDPKKTMFRYDGWDYYNDGPDTRIRHLKASARLKKKLGVEFMYKCATANEDIFRLWSPDEWERGDRDPELTLKVVVAVNIESKLGNRKENNNESD